MFLTVLLTLNKELKKKKKMCDLLSPDIKKGLIAEKTSAQDKFIPRSSLYLGHFP